MESISFNSQNVDGFLYTMFFIECNHNDSFLLFEKRVNEWYTLNQSIEHVGITCMEWLKWIDSHLNVAWNAKLTLCNKYKRQHIDIDREAESAYAFTNNYVQLRLSLLFYYFFTVPPTLRAVPQNGQVAARKGSTVTLECKASGNPVPSIYW